MRYRQRFTVEGRGSFPLDMLRYDHCWPSDSGSVKLIEAGMMPLAKARVIVLLRDVFDKEAQPEIRRWQSFGWRVTSVRSAKQ